MNDGEITELEKKICPLCSKPLAGSEYNKAKAELNSKLKNNYENERKKHKEDFDKKIKEMQNNHKREINTLTEKLDKRQKDIQNQQDKSHKKDMALFKKEYAKIRKEYERNFDALRKQKEADYKNQLREKDRQIKESMKNNKDIETRAYERAKMDYDDKLKSREREISEFDIQNKRFRTKVEDLENQLKMKQSELQGEVGELNLYKILSSTFDEDKFKRQKRGQHSGDIIQTIRTKSGELDTRIIYDNKENTKVTPNDIRKAQKYKKEHNTEYVLIVSTQIPKSYASNGLFGRKDGVMVVNPQIIVEIVSLCRNNIIDIARMSQGGKDREAKESRLFSYMISPEFTGLMKSINRINANMRDLQDKEEKVHQKIWKERKGLTDAMFKALVDIESDVENITQRETIMETIAVHKP